MDRIFLRRNKEEDKFVEISKYLGAEYVEGKTKAIFISRIPWTSDGNGDKVRPAIGLKSKEGIEIGQVRKSCMNFEEKTNIWYTQSDLEWIIKTLTKLKKHCPKK